MVPSYESLVPYLGRALGLSDAELARAFRPARDAEFPAVLALRRNVLRDVWWDDEAFMRWRYFDRKTASGTCPYWVFTRDGEVVGGCGTEPVVLAIDGEATDAVRTMDIMVQPNIDGLGLGAFMNLALSKTFPIMMVSGSNERSHQLLRRLFHHAADLHVWKRLVASRGILESRLSPGALSDVVARSVDLALAVGRWTRRHASTPTGVEIRRLDEFDARTTDLSLRREAAGGLMVRRGAEYLTWRFTRNPRCLYESLGAWRSGALVGYVVTRLNRARPNLLEEGEIVDWLAAPGRDSAAVLSALFEAAVKLLSTKGAQIVSCVGVDGALAGAMQVSGFQLRATSGPPFFVRASQPSVHARLASGSGWFLTRGDFDVE